MTQPWRSSRSAPWSNASSSSFIPGVQVGWEVVVGIHMASWMTWEWFGGFQWQGCWVRNIMEMMRSKKLHERKEQHYLEDHFSGVHSHVSCQFAVERINCECVAKLYPMEMSNIPCLFICHTSPRKINSSPLKNGGWKTNSFPIGAGR